MSTPADLTLVPLPPAALHALAAGDLEAASRHAGVALTPYFLEHRWLWELRLGQLAEDPAAARWFARAAVLPNGDVVGHVGFHGPPDPRGMVEVGYSVAPEHRRHGHGSALLGAALAWASGEEGVRVVRASVAPDNEASLRTLAPFGFRHVGEQEDEEDGTELLFERPVGAPGAYTHGHHESVLRSHRWRTAENSCAYLLPHLAPGMALLDVGCGPGTITADLAELLGPTGRVTAVERTDDALALARDEAARRGTATVDFRVADALDLDLPDDSFDVVHAHQVLQHLADPVQALREMRRVCRPGGLVAVRDSDYGAFTWHPAAPALDRWLEVYHRVARSNHAEPDAGRRLLAWARAAGFEDVTAGSSTWCFATVEDRAWWGGLWADRVVSSDLARQAQERGVASPADLGEIAAGWRTWAAEPDGWFSVLHGEVLARA